MGLRKQKVEKIYEIVDGNFSAHYCHITSHEANRYELPMLSNQGARGSSMVGRNQTNHKTCLVAGSQSRGVISDFAWGGGQLPLTSI